MTSFFCLCVFDMGWHEGLWIGIYKEVEVQEVKMIKMQRVLCVCEE